jgi:K+ transporter
MLKMVMFAPMASAIVSTTAAVNSGAFRIMRRAYRRSFIARLLPGMKTSNYTEKPAGCGVL